MVPLDGRPHLPQDVRQWLGDSRGRWDGDTLVVETTNFLRETAFGRYAGSVGRLGGSGPNIHLIERFTRIDADTLLYEATVEDETTWVRPWTYAIPMRRSDAAVYEYACHEGNYGLVNILARRTPGSGRDREVGGGEDEPSISRRVVRSDCVRGADAHVRVGAVSGSAPHAVGRARSAGGLGLPFPHAPGAPRGAGRPGVPDRGRGGEPRAGGHRPERGALEPGSAAHGGRRQRGPGRRMGSPGSTTTSGWTAGRRRSRRGGPR